ncbi:BICD family-like cargo adapter 2 [Heptranchias perlo]|uniref:BICD family-like cargo adapter 2 n=1 Tax=Heptranchias perlo TaxID=212740 RepID=UPI003559FC4C
MQSLQASLLLVQGQNEQLDLQLQQIQSELEQVKGANHQLRNQVREINDEIDLRDLTTLNQSLQSELQHMMESNSVTESLEETVSLGSMVNSPEHFRSGSDELRSLRQIHRQDKGLLKEREEQIQRLHDQILPKAMVKRLKSALQRVIHPDQTCTENSRKISDSLVLLRDTIAYVQDRG